jgi:hypothetical protein
MKNETEEIEPIFTQTDVESFAAVLRLTEILGETKYELDVYKRECERKDTQITYLCKEIMELKKLIRK